MDPPGLRDLQWLPCSCRSGILHHPNEIKPQLKTRSEGEEAPFTITKVQCTLPQTEIIIHSTSTLYQVLHLRNVVHGRILVEVQVAHCHGGGRALFKFQLKYSDIFCKLQKNLKISDKLPFER